MLDFTGSIFYLYHLTLSDGWAVETIVQKLTLWYEWVTGLAPLWSVVDQLTTPGWWQLLLCFLFSSFLMINRLNAVEKNGFEGTLVGTLVMPYFSGFPNLCFAYLMLTTHQSGAVVLENCLVNNLTNLTLILAIPCLLWGLNLFKTAPQQQISARVNHLSLLLSILALVFFSVSTLFVSKDGRIDRFDGMLLVAIFIFWQLFHIFDLLKNNTRTGQRIKKRIIVDMAIIGLCAWGVFSSIDGLLQWVSHSRHTAFFQSHLGVLSGILMVLPNAFLAVYYAAVQRSDIAYSSQIGDCHICLPLCVGLFAMFSPITVPPGVETVLFIIISASAAHFFFTAFFKQLPRIAGAALAGLYLFFCYTKVL